MSLGLGEEEVMRVKGLYRELSLAEALEEALEEVLEERRGWLGGGFVFSLRLQVWIEEWSDSIGGVWG